MCSSPRTSRWSQPTPTCSPTCTSRRAEPRPGYRRARVGGGRRLLPVLLRNGDRRHARLLRDRRSPARHRSRHCPRTSTRRASVPGYPRPQVRHAGVLLAGRRVRALRVVQPHPRCAAVLRLLQPRRPDLLAADGRLSRCQQPGRQLWGLGAAEGDPRHHRDARGRGRRRLRDLHDRRPQEVRSLRLCGRARGPAVPAPDGQELRVDPDRSGTVQDVPFSVAVPCTPTLDTTVGSTCATNTTADTVLPGTVKEAKRTIWQIDQLQVFDGGPDGLAVTTAGNTLLRCRASLPHEHRIDPR